MNRVLAHVYNVWLQHVFGILLLSHPGHCDEMHAIAGGMLTAPRKSIPGGSAASSQT